MSDELKVKSNSIAIGGGATAAGGGTLIVMVAKSFPDGSLAQAALLHAAPTLTVAIGALATYGFGRVRQYLAKKDFEDAVSAAKSSMVEMLKNQETSDGHKNNIRQNLEQIESMAMESKLYDVKKLVVNGKSSTT